MEIDFAVLADAANESKEGKLNVLGIFEALFAADVPCRHPMMTLALRFRANAGEKGSEYKVDIRLLDDDGKILFQLPPFHLNIPADVPALNPVSNLIVNLTDIEFPRYGSYRYDILINGVLAKEISLPVQRPSFV